MSMLLLGLAQSFPEQGKQQTETQVCYLPADYTSKLEA